MQHNADATAASKGGSAPLHCAAKQGRVRVVEALVASGAAVDAVHNSCGSTPLHLAAELGHTEVLKVLLQHGAAVDAVRSSYGSTPLHWQRSQGTLMHSRSCCSMAPTLMQLQAT